jgi:hypothetical protein
LHLGAQHGEDGDVGDRHREAPANGALIEGAGEQAKFAERMVNAPLNRGNSRRLP